MKDQLEDISDNISVELKPQPLEKVNKPAQEEKVRVMITNGTKRIVPKVKLDRALLKLA